MPPGLRLLLAAAAALPLSAVGLLSVAADGGSALKADEESQVPPKRALVATVLQHNQRAPVDMMLGHHIRMLTSSRKNVAQAAVINAKVPGVDNKGGTEHDPVLAQLARTYGTTGSVQVVELETDEDLQVKLLQKVFSIRKGSTAAFAKKFLKQDLASPEKKRAMAYFTAMMHFIDLCSQAEYNVELCINMESQSFLHRQDKKGLIELASDLFDNDEQAVALQPPSYCDYTQAHHRPSWAKKATWTSSSFTKCVGNATRARPEAGPANMLFNRQRLMSMLPLAVDPEDLDLGKGFDHAFMAGLQRKGAIKGMQCGHSFLIRPADQEATCKGRTIELNQQAHLACHQARQAGQMLATKSGEYFLFDQLLLDGLEVLTDRIERGMIPAPMGNVSDKCQEMCPSKDRIVQEGLAW